MDKYAKTILTIVAIGVIGINIQLFKSSNEIQKMSICGTFKDALGDIYKELNCVDVHPTTNALSVNER